MRGSGIIGTVALVWLLIGVFAAWQRDYFKNDNTYAPRRARSR